MDDPLRLVIDGGRLHARSEAGGAWSTPGAAVQPGVWYVAAAVKRGGKLTLYVDGRLVGSVAVPESIASRAQDCALGGNPHYAGNEFLAACFADFRLYARALREDEVQGLAHPD
jgi:hypothetical protein